MALPTSTAHRLLALTPPLPWHQPQWLPHEDPDAPTVILLHGLWRSKHAMLSIARALHHAGFATLNVPYPSPRMDVAALVDHISHILDSTIGDRPIHAVTHSLGGIIAKSAIANSRWNLHRLVMIAPPTSGSEIVDHLANYPLLHHCLGPAGMSLGTQGLPAQLPPIPNHIEAAAIMGKRDSIKCFNKLFQGDHDGIVSVSGGNTTDLKAFAVVDADHTFIAAHPDTQRLTIEFLQTGALSL